MNNIPCFIRKNTSDLQKKLESLGYKMSSTFDPSEEVMWTAGDVYYSTSWNEPIMGVLEVGDISMPWGVYCGENCNLFILIASLQSE